MSRGRHLSKSLSAVEPGGAGPEARDVVGAGRLSGLLIVASNESSRRLFVAEPSTGAVPRVLKPLFSLLLPLSLSPSSSETSQTESGWRLLVFKRSESNDSHRASFGDGCLVLCGGGDPAWELERSEMTSGMVTQLRVSINVDPTYCLPTYVGQARRCVAKVFVGRVVINHQ